MNEFQGKTIVITGAASGIGLATVEYFRSKGANVVAADLNRANNRSFGSEDRDNFLALDYDASVPESANNIIAKAVEKFGGVDCLVVSAGVYEDQPVQGMSVEQWKNTIDINLSGVFYITKAAIPAFRDGGAIVTLASIAAHSGASAGHVHYGASKGGVLAYSRSLAKDLAPKIRVNSVSPGTIETPMTVGLRTRTEHEDAIPLKRYGKPFEVANVIGFLCSGASSYITGETIIVSGGLYIG